MPSEAELFTESTSAQSTAGQLNARSVAEVNVATGAYDVRYGNALSGVVEVKLNATNAASRGIIVFVKESKWSDLGGTEREAKARELARAALAAHPRSEVVEQVQPSPPEHCGHCRRASAHDQCPGECDYRFQR